MFWNDAVRVTQQALVDGYLMPITTEAEVMTEQDVSYLAISLPPMPVKSR